MEEQHPAGLSAVVNAPERITLYAPGTGTETHVSSAAAARELEGLGFSRVRYDPEQAAADWRAAYAAVGPAMDQFATEVGRDGLIRDETYAMLAAAFGAMNDASRVYLEAIAKATPREQQVRDLADAVVEHGEPLAAGGTGFERVAALVERHRDVIDRVLAEAGHPATQRPTPTSGDAAPDQE